MGLNMRKPDGNKKGGGGGGERARVTHTLRCVLEKDILILLSTGST